MHPFLRCLILPGLLVVAIAHPRDAYASTKKSYVASVVTASVDKGYHRKKNKDGSYQREYYALSLGGQADGTTSHASIEGVARLRFETIVKDQLAKQNYLMAPDAASAGLLIHLLWGMTDPPSEHANLNLAIDEAGKSFAAYKMMAPDAGGGFGIPALTPDQREAESQAESALMYMLMLERERARALAPTACVLGYIDAVNDLTDSPAIHAGLGTSYRDLWDEISERRYYVLVFAYDFKLLQREKKLKPLWVTRVNIRADGNRFDEQLAAMLARAGQYFGRPTRGVTRDAEGRVEIGEAEVLGVVEEHREKPATPQSPPADPRRTPSSGPTDASQPPKQQR